MITFSILSIDDLPLVLKWRTSEHVTKYMFTDIEDSLENQIQWFNKVKNDSKQKYWIIRYKNVSIGLISLNQLDTINLKASSGFYIGEQEYSRLASRIFPYFLNYIFFECGLNKIYIEVMSDNQNMIKMDMHYGFRHIGTFEKHIYKNGKFHNVELLEILRDTWMGNFTKYHNLKPKNY